MANDQSQVMPLNNHSDGRFVPNLPLNLAHHPAAKRVTATATTPANSPPSVLKPSAPKAITKPTAKTKKPNPTLVLNLSSALNNPAPAAAVAADPNTTPTRELPQLFDLNTQQLLFRPTGLLDDKKKQERMDEVELLFPNWRWMSNRRDVNYYEEWKPWEEKWEAIWEKFEGERKGRGVDAFGNQKAVFGEAWTLETRAPKPLAEKQPQENGQNMVRYHGNLRQQLAGRLASLTGQAEPQGGGWMDVDIYGA
ncbi:hypothetical protein B0T14DRAFT_568780 [Immersiella caudata]|uniref:Uncharacterized protein n=1 Tax=Immersiella caudata TaxID=314043 RepID=A0AA40BXD1_9PEZI|nr:hypothetical protein B0T14DRAFT_568780 [Immersiella caudata]